MEQYFILIQFRCCRLIFNFSKNIIWFRNRYYIQLKPKVLVNLKSLEQELTDNNKQQIIMYSENIFKRKKIEETIEFGKKLLFKESLSLGKTEAFVFKPSL